MNIFTLPSSRKGKASGDGQSSPPQYLVNSLTDKAVFTVALTTILTFLLVFLLPMWSVGIRAIWLLYPNLLFTITCFGYYIYTRPDLNEDLLWYSVLFGLSTTATYLPMDWLFSRKVHFITYRSLDFFGNVTTPIGLILTWIILATLAVYCYQRLRIFGLHYFVASGVTGIASSIGCVGIYSLGNELWIWNELQVGNMPHIASVPIFMPITFLLTFTLFPYHFHRTQHPLIAGLRCGLFLGFAMFLSYVVLLRI